MSTIRLSRRDAQAVLGAVSLHGLTPSAEMAVGRLRDALAPPKPSPKKTAAKKAKAATVRAKKASHREETSEIYREVEKRAGGRCECGCGVPFGIWDCSPELDHGVGRGKARQTVANCWMLARVCHRLRHSGTPSQAFWLARFAAHCEHHGYTAEARKARDAIEADALVSQAAALTGGGR